MLLELGYAHIMDRQADRRTDEHTRGRYYICINILTLHIYVIIEKKPIGIMVIVKNCLLLQ